MHSTLTAKPGDDPHDVLVVAPDAVRVAPSDEKELSSLLHQAARHRSHTLAASDIAVGHVPPVDTTFRPGSVNDVRVPGGRRSTAARALRGFMALLLAACIGVAAVGWKAYGEVAKRQIAKWTTQFALTSSLTSEQPASAAQPAPPAAPADAADAASQPPAPPAQAAAEAVAPAAAPSADQAPSLQSMARDLASVTQQVEQLKVSIDELKASQQQMSRDLAKASEVKASEVKAPEVKPSEANPRPRIAAAPPRAVAARVRKPAPSYPPPQALLPPMPQQAPYVPRQTEPQPQFAVEPPQPDPELTSVPRPPMPLR